MISEIKDIFSMLLDLYRSCMDKKYNEFNNCIDKIFNITKKIEENYLDVLSTVKYGVVYEDWKGEEAVKYLSKVEYNLKSERVYIREELKHLNTVHNGELEKFVGAIFNIMYCEYVDRFKIGKDMEHRFSGLMLDAKRYQYSLYNQKRFLDDIEFMINEVSESWKIVCDEYFRLKEKYSNKI